MADNQNATTSQTHAQSTNDEASTFERTLDGTQARSDLAKLWKAFLDAEDRIAQLEAEVDEADQADGRGAVGEGPAAAVYTAHLGEGGPFPPATPFGDIYAVIDIEGIGEVYSDKLNAVNIVDTEQLWLTDPEAVATELGILVERVERWRSMAELMAVDGIGGQYAELLVTIDIHSIEELAGAEPTQIAEKAQGVAETRDVRIQGNKITEKIAASWVKAAQEHDAATGRVHRARRS